MTVLNRIGQTPLLLIDGVHVKLECSNPSGSIKDRALTALVLNHFVERKLQMEGSNLVLVTSGWAGISLSNLHSEIDQRGDYCYCTKEFPEIAHQLSRVHQRHDSPPTSECKEANSGRGFQRMSPVASEGDT